MEKSIKNAFIYMFKDKDWGFKLLKFLILGVPYICLLYCTFNSGQYLNKTYETSLALILLFLTIIFTFISTGYIFKCTNNVINMDEETQTLLPEWGNNIAKYYFIGLKNLGAVLLFMVPIIILVLIFYLILEYSVLRFIGPNHIPSDMYSMMRMNLSFNFTCFALFIPLSIILLFFDALKRVFATEFKVTAYFKWGSALKLMAQNLYKYVGILLVHFCIYILMLSLFFNILSNKLPLIGCIILAVVNVYYNLVVAYLVGIIGSKDNKVVS